MGRKAIAGKKPRVFLCRLSLHSRTSLFGFVGVDEDLPLAFVAFDFNGHRSCLLLVCRTRRTPFLQKPLGQAA